MQQLRKTIYERCLIGITGTAWVAGLLVAGSDSPYMPWLNGIGLIIFLGASILLGKCLEASSSSADDNKIIPQFYQRPDAMGKKKEKKHPKINIPYALGA
jgi:hypothetical protein